MQSSPIFFILFWHIDNFIAVSELLQKEKSISEGLQTSIYLRNKLNLELSVQLIQSGSRDVLSG